MPARKIVALLLCCLVCLPKSIHAEELIPLQTSRLPNLDAARIAGRQKAFGGVGNLLQSATDVVGNLAFEAAFDRRSAPLLVDAQTKVDSGAEVAVLVAEIYTNQVGFVEIGPMTVVDGESVLSALKTFARRAASPSIRKDRPGTTMSYRIRVLSKVNRSRGFTDESFPDELMTMATEQFSIEESARAGREAARDVARQAATEQATAAKNRSREQVRDRDGPRDNSGLGVPRGSESKGPQGSSEAEAPTEVDNDTDGVEIDGAESEGTETGGQEIRLLR